ncbi:hypothetical protein M1D30_04065 [Prevotella sp. E15-22]|uniref:hypothetical protein n=1 Tax=Prevotella sp. E15-22 TaxID=2937774 RepID=UPI00205B0642|nr:hypothetical protein [Prevotella sp. E15-22]UPS45357.1 hypothetical protein M1D30_04065 [Prevotella sp. E15-22]
MNNIRYNEDDFKGFVEDLISSGRIEDKEAGIAKYMIDNGYESLSEKQKYVFDQMIKDNTVEECQRCGVDIPWCEMLEALYNGGLCNYCQHVKEKMDAE